MKNWVPIVSETSSNESGESSVDLTEFGICFLLISDDCSELGSSESVLVSCVRPRFQVDYDLSSFIKVLSCDFVFYIVCGISYRIVYTL